MMAWYWAVWLLIGFGLPEGIALGTGHPEGTLSDTVWRWFDVVPGQTPRQWTILHVIMMAFMTWLWFHFVFRAWTVWHLHRGG